MGNHKRWRAIAKKMRRKRIRKKIAQERDALLQKEQERREKSPSYQAWKAAQEELERFQEEEETRLQIERHKKWEEDEEIAQKLWKEKQEQLNKIKKEKEAQELLIRKEWEEQQKKKEEAEEAERKRKEEKQRQQEELLRQIDDFINKGGEMPSSINIPTETNPGKPACPFFTKTGTCRFSDRCSRNHQRPGISKVLLIPNFYSHFGMEQSLTDEYDSDLLLEYEDSETYQHFKDFYEDVLPEFENYGKIVQFKVCCNFEPHLRGNVYVEYAEIRQAVAAYRKFHGRWYGGRQLNIEFCRVSSWKAAICGLFFRRKCPKGKICNFLHVFRNPGNQFAWADRDFQPYKQRNNQHGRSQSGSFSPRHNGERNGEDRPNWRWSESPEPVEISERNRERVRKTHYMDSSGHSSRRRRDEGSHRKRRSRSRDEDSHRKRNCSTDEESYVKKISRCEGSHRTRRSKSRDHESLRSERSSSSRSSHSSRSHKHRSHKHFKPQLEPCSP